jgi:hypothetical protein
MPPIYKVIMEPKSPKSNKAAIKQAVEFCLKNPKEKPTTGARIYDADPGSVRIALARIAKKAQRRVSVRHGGHNRVLDEAQEAAVLRYMEEEAVGGLGATKTMLFAAICHLRQQEEPPKPHPSWRWFQRWMKKHAADLHTIKTKPIARARVETHTEETVEDWFVRLRKKLKERKIKKAKQIHNFDETGVRVGCPGGEDIVVPIWMKEKYTPSPENRTSVSVIEDICADGSKPLPPAIICPGKRHMENWFHESMEGGERIMLSASGYTNEQLAIQWLEHFIKYTGAGPTKKWKLLLMDGHKSHRTPEFTLLALQNHIEPFAFPSHLTHILQPLDVGVFRPWKHWHKMAIQTALRSLDFEYSITSLFRDLTKIRAATFKPSTIINAYAEAGMWPVSCKQALKKMKQYKAPQNPLERESTPEELELQLPTHRKTPKTIFDTQISMEEWEHRMPPSMSSPSAQRFKKTMKAVRVNLNRAAITEMEHKVLKNQVDEQGKRKLTSRKSVQTGGSLEASWALQKIKEKRQFERSEALRKARKACDDWVKRAEKAYHLAGVDARRTNRNNRNKVIELEAAGLLVPAELLITVRDPSKDPTPAELDALLPNPSLVQAVEELEREQINKMNNDIPIDPQLLADNPGIQQSAARIEVSSESEDGEEYDFNYNDSGDESAESIASHSSSGDDSMNADFISFND